MTASIWFDYRGSSIRSMVRWVKRSWIKAVKGFEAIEGETEEVYSDYLMEWLQERLNPGLADGSPDRGVIETGD